MDIQFLRTEAKRLTASPKGILAIDESAPTCDARFTKLGVPTTEENRRSYRELLITAPGIEEYISGMILFDETIRQKTKDGVLFTDVFKQKGMSIGIKVDLGTKDLALCPEEKVTEGLDGLRTRLIEYKGMGATFCKWRMFPAIDLAKNLPSDTCIYTNTHAMARYAALCLEVGLVPIVEPELNMEGSHTIDECIMVYKRIMASLFSELKMQRVDVSGIILKTGMIVSGTKCPTQASTEEIAEKTVNFLKENVPADIGGIVFLSGGQTEQQATDNLRAMHNLGALPWPLSFSFGRAIQKPALEIWAKNQNNIKEAQDALLKMAKANSLATVGK